MKRNSRMTAKMWVRDFPPETAAEVKDFLPTEQLKSLMGTPDGDYDAEILDGADRYLAEVNLDDSGRVTDLNCTCNRSFCVHLAAMLWKIARGEVATAKIMR